MMPACRSKAIEQESAGFMFFGGTDKVGQSSIAIQTNNLGKSFSNEPSGVMECLLDRTSLTKACTDGLIFMPCHFDAGVTGDFELIAAFGGSSEGIALRSVF